MRETWRERAYWRLWNHWIAAPLPRWQPARALHRAWLRRQF